MSEADTAKGKSRRCYASVAYACDGTDKADFNSMSFEHAANRDNGQDAVSLTSKTVTIR